MLDSQAVDMFERMSRHLKNAKTLSFTTCHHLSLEFVGADAQLWVQDEDDPIPYGRAFTLRDEPSESLFFSSFDSWVSNHSVGTAPFRFVAPVGATKMEMKDMLAQASAR